MQPDYNQPLADYVRFFAGHSPTVVASIDGTRQSTYAELNQRSSQVANGLLSAGCQAGQRVAFIGVNSAEYIEIFFGAMKALAVIVGVNWRLAPPELHYILSDSATALVFCDPAFEPTLRELQATLPALTTIISTDPARFAAWRDPHSAADPHLPHSASDTVVQFYTSGTTGKPKGVPLDNRAMSEHRKAEDHYGDWFLRSNRREVSINAMPNFHVGGVGWLLMSTFRGATVVQMAAPDPALFLDKIQEHNATHLFAVAIILGLMLESQKKNPRDISSLRCYHYGASAIAPSVLQEAIAVMGCQFAQYYGMTEANGVVTNLPPEQHQLSNPERLKSCGRPMAGIELKIIDEAGNPLPPNCVGEILVKAPGMMTGYWNNPEATAKTLIDGWYHSGDGGRLDDEGYLYIADRIKDMIISGGENIYPTEVENALLSHPAVAEVAVIGVADEKWGEAVKAIIVPAPDQRVTDTELIDYLRAHLAGFKIPRRYQFVDSIPRTPTGKVQKFKLKDL